MSNNVVGIVSQTIATETWVATIEQPNVDRVMKRWPVKLTCNGGARGSGMFVPGLGLLFVPLPRVILSVLDKEIAHVVHATEQMKAQNASGG